MTDPTRALSAQTINSLLADTNPYLSCDECFAKVDEYLERRVANPGYQDPAMKAHLAGCGACAEEAETLRQLLTNEAD